MTRWRDVDMVERWIASAWLLKEKHFRKVRRPPFEISKPPLLFSEENPNQTPPLRRWRNMQLCRPQGEVSKTTSLHDC